MWEFIFWHSWEWLNPIQSGVLAVFKCHLSTFHLFYCWFKKPGLGFLVWPAKRIDANPAEISYKCATPCRWYRPACRSRWPESLVTIPESAVTFDLNHWSRCSGIPTKAPSWAACIGRSRARWASWATQYKMPWAKASTKPNGRLRKRAATRQKTNSPSFTVGTRKRWSASEGSRNPYEFGVKVGIATTIKGTLIIGMKPETAYVDLGYRGVDRDNAGLDIKHRGKFKSLTDEEKKSLKRRQAIEPIIGLFYDCYRCPDGANCTAIASDFCTKTSQTWFHELGLRQKLLFQGRPVSNLIFRYIFIN